MVKKSLERELARLRKIRRKQEAKKEKKRKIRRLKIEIFKEKHRKKLMVAKAIGKGIYAAGKKTHEAAVKIEERKARAEKTQRRGKKRRQVYGFGMAQPSGDLY